MIKGRRRAWLRGFTLVELMIVITIIAIIFSVMIPNFVRARHNAFLASCQSNCRTLASAVEGYAVDNAGAFPTDFNAAISGGFLKALPTCPSVGISTYAYSTQRNPDRFTIMCTGPGANHLDIPQDFPQYTSAQGLIIGR